MTVPKSTDKRSSLIPEKPITGVDLQRLIASIQQHDTDIIIEGYGTANVALSLSFDNDSVYKLNKNYLRHSLNGNSLRDSDEIKKELLASVLCNESLSNIQILRQNKVRILLLHYYKENLFAPCHRESGHLYFRRFTTHSRKFCTRQQVATKKPH